MAAVANYFADLFGGSQTFAAPAAPAPPVLTQSIADDIDRAGMESSAATEGALHTEAV